MQTLKIKYKCSDAEFFDIFSKYQRSYSSCLHFMYNRVVDEPNILEVKLRELAKTINNIECLDSWFIQSAIKEAKAIYASRAKLEFSLNNYQVEHYNEDQIIKAERLFEEHRYDVIFGGKKLFIQRCKGKITREEFQTRKLSPIYSIGESSNKCIRGNRKFNILENLNIRFQPNSKTHFELELLNIKNCKQDLEKLYLLQQEHSIAITYKLDPEYIYISFEEEILHKDLEKVNPIKNRVFSIDMNPDYIGWCIVDWKSENSYKIIKSGVFSFKQLSDEYNSLKDKKLKSNSDQKVYLTNKRHHEIIQVAKQLIKLAIYYKCEVFGLEDLNIKSKDKKKGKNFNRKCNNQWTRNLLVNNLSKRCHIYGIKILKINPKYSSFVGNFLFRHLGLPDMCLAAFELSRRTYEYFNQYITKQKEIKKNIIFPDVNKFKRFYMKSLEEFCIDNKFITLKKIYDFFKKDKKTYRLSISQDQQFIRCFSYRSKILHNFFI